MAEEVKIELIDTARGRLTVTGWEMERGAIVTGVTGNGYDKIISAAGATGMPSLGDSHPARAICTLREIIPEAVDAESVKFRLIYADPQVSTRQRNIQYDTIETGGTVSQVETNKDKDANVMSVQYTYPSNYPHASNLQGVTDTVGKLISKLIPEHSVTITKLEGSNPLAKSKQYVGTVNTAGWSMDSGAAPRTWLCTSIIGRSDDEGDNYTVTYTFQFRKDTWDANVMYVDPYTGQPPSDLVADTGIKTYRLYEEKDFGNLNL